MPNIPLDKFLLYWGPFHYLDVDSWISLLVQRVPLSDDVELTWNFNNEGGYNWPVDVGHPDEVLLATLTMTEAEQEEIRHFKWLNDATGSFAKMWPYSWDEPEEWQVKAYWLTPPPASMFTFYYLESQDYNFASPDEQFWQLTDRVCFSGTGELPTALKGIGQYPDESGSPVVP